MRHAVDTETQLTTGVLPRGIRDDDDDDVYLK
jgi:hypothetical protein